MPYLIPIMPENGCGKELRVALRPEIEKIRTIFAKMFDIKDVDSVVWMPKLLSDAEWGFQQNMLPFELYIDLGQREEEIDKESLEDLKAALIEICPYLDTIEFGVCGRPHRGGQFVQHKPENAQPD